MRGLSGLLFYFWKKYFSRIYVEGLEGFCADGGCYILDVTGVFLDSKKYCVQDYMRL